MEIPVTAGPWLVLGVVLGILVPLLAAVVALSARRRPPHPEDDQRPRTPSPAGFGEDDLPAFLDSPPGSAGEPAPAPGGWPALSSSPAAPPDAPPSPPGRRGRRDTVGVLTAMATTALLLVGAAAAVAAAGSRETTAAPTAPAPRRDADGLTARLTFGGLVLERRAVGVTATYPVVRVSADGPSGDGAALAHVELPTFNCLADQAPADPVAAGCSRSLTEYAELAAPDLTVRRDGDRVRISGRFPTYLRPNGSAPVRTGRVYDVTLTVEPREGRSTQGRRPAVGELGLGSERARTAEAGPNDVVYGT